MQSVLAARLRALRDIASVVNAGSDLPTILRRVVAAVCQHTAWSSGSIMRVDLESGFAELVVRHDPLHESDHGVPTRWQLTTSPTLHVATSATALVIPDAQRADEFPGYQGDAILRGYRTAVVLPIDATDEVGNRLVLSVLSWEVVSVDEAELAFLTTIAHFGAIAVEKAKRLDAERAQSDRLRRALAVNESLLARALAGDSMRNLLSTVEALVPEPLIVVDLIKQSVLARRSPAADLVSEPEWQRLIQRKGLRMLMDLAHTVVPSGFNHRVEIDFTSFGLDVRLQAIVEAMEIDDEKVGALIVFPRSPAGSPLDLLLAQEAKLAINVHLLRDYVRLQSRTEASGELLTAVLRGVSAGTDEVCLRAERLGIDLGRQACLLAVGLPKVGATPPNGFLQALTGLATRLWAGALVAPQGPDVVVLLPGADKLARVQLLAKKIVHELTWQGQEPTVAIGGPCQQVTSYPQVWRECLGLLSLSRTFSRSGVVDATAFGPFAALLSAMNGTAVEDFIVRTLGAAVGYDARHKASLVDTVARFIEGGCRYQTCADSLGIHVSTLRYRIDRFQALAGADLTDPETRLSLALAVRLFKLKQGDVAFPL